MDLNVAECLKDRMAEVHDLKIENVRLRAVLERVYVLALSHLADPSCETMKAAERALTAA
jgi:hypothetical protein